MSMMTIIRPFRDSRSEALKGFDHSAFCSVMLLTLARGTKASYRATVLFCILCFKAQEWLMMLKISIIALCIAYIKADDAAITNYHRHFAKVYLPPESSTFVLPEVIDNRARIPIVPEVIDNRVRIPIGIDTRFQLQPASSLETPFANGNVYSEFTKMVNQGKNIAADNTLFTNALFSQVKIVDMTCQNNGDELFFRATIAPLKNFDYPIIENEGSAACKLSKIKNEYRLDLGKNEFWNCGVIDCSTEADKLYCLSLRFPTISGLRLKDDFKVTLQCRVQEKIASHTRRINLKTIDTAARMAAAIATGGQRSAFQTDIALYRKTFGSDNEFDAKIQAGGTVILGEEILLRAAVREGDGWKYSKINEVTVHFVEKRQRKRVMNSLWILDSEGCLNPQVREICSGEQYRVGPLESYLLFKAFMFESMQESDDLVLTVKVTGCLNGEDCILNCPGSHTRKARDVGNQNRNNTYAWQNDITFRVKASPDKISQRNNFQSFIPIFYILLLFVFLICLFFVNHFFNRKVKTILMDK